MKTCSLYDDNNVYLLIFLVIAFVIPSTLCNVTKSKSTKQWTPQLDATSTKEQREFYSKFEKILPYLDIEVYPEDSVKVYIYGGKDQHCTDNTKPLYFTWYSKKCKFSLSFFLHSILFNYSLT